MRRRYITLMFLLAPILSRMLVAQAADETTAAVSAALAALESKIPPGPTALLYSGKTAALVEEFTRNTGRPVVDIGGKVDCGYNPAAQLRTCSLNGIASIVKVETIEIVGDSAKAYVFISYASGSKSQPIEGEGYRVKLARVGGKWSVVSVAMPIIS